jgi:hypothetical protein
MATVSGVPVSNIEKISSIDATNIVKISGIATANIPGWPSSGPTCETVSFRSASDPAVVCTAEIMDYSYDSVNNLLYVFGQCGVKFAKTGFYSDGRRIYRAVGGTLVPYGECGR